MTPTPPPNPFPTIGTGDVLQSFGTIARMVFGLLPWYMWVLLVLVLAFSALVSLRNWRRRKHAAQKAEERVRLQEEYHRMMLKQGKGKPSR
jgi:membrane protein implicated in regulation of membrane protease activity